MSDPEVEQSDGRNESVEQRMDRNWGELLQELRVLQTGVQILAGFLLTLPFQNKFDSLDDFQVGLYLFTVCLAAITTALILLPVSVHRRLFRKRLKSTLVSAADRITKLALVCVGLLTVASTTLVFSVVAGHDAGVTAGVALLAALTLLLVYVPVRLHRTAARANDQEQ